MPPQASCVAGIILCLIGSNSVMGYELATHAGITQKAYEQSVLGNPWRNKEIYRDLGIQIVFTNPNPFGDTYFDVFGVQEKVRRVSIFELRPMAIPSERSFTVPAWLMRGTIREDDATGEKNPQDDPYHEKLVRPLNHFYDPYYDRALTIPGLLDYDPLVQRSPDWALGVMDAFATPTAPNPARRNHFTLLDAREAMYRALTGMDGTNTPLPLGQTPRIRNAYWATTFRALGSVVHHIQDMAQPQHTRNEAHSGVGPYLVIQEYITGHESIYEKYIDARATNVDIHLIDQVVLGRPQEPLIYAGYTPPSFNRARDYFSTREGVYGRGLADYSNRGFFTAAKNLGNTDYPLPSNDRNHYVEETVSTDGLLPHVGNDSVKMRFLLGDVRDTQESSLSNIRITTESLWNTFLGAEKTYTLNRFNYDDMAGILVPRAVSYSAGLIDYFFRGRLEIQPPDEGIYALLDHSDVKNINSEGFKTIKLKLKNVTRDIVENGNKHRQNMSKGRLVAVAKYRRNLCYLPNLEGEFRPDIQGRTWNGCTIQEYRYLDEEITVSEPIENISLLTGLDVAALPLTFKFKKPIPINATDLYLQVVYRGALGEEQDAVVVGTKDMREPTFMSFFNGTDYYMVDGVFYTYDQIESDPTLRDRAQAPPGVQFISAVDLKNMKFWFKPNKIVGRIDHLPPGNYVRIAYLTDLNTLRINYSGTGYDHKKLLQGQEVVSLNIANDVHDVSSKISQSHFVPTQLSGGGYLDEPIVTSVKKARGTFYSSLVYLFQTNYSLDESVSKTQLEQLFPTLSNAADINPKLVTISFE